MGIRIDRRIWLLFMAGAMIGIQLRYPTEATTIWPPILFVAIAALLYRKEIKTYDWPAFKSAPFWGSAFFAVTQGMIAQAIGIVMISHILGVEEPAIPIGLTPAVMISAVVFSAILEELVYRFVLFGFLERLTGFWIAALVSSGLFAFAHYNVSAYLGYFLLGIVWCRVYKKTGNIGVVIMAHMAFNLIAMVVMSVRG